MSRTDFSVQHRIRYADESETGREVHWSTNALRFYWVKYHQSLQTQAAAYGVHVE